MSLRIKRHVARTDLKTIRSRLIAVIEFKIQNGLAVVAKRKEIALKVDGRECGLGRCGDDGSELDGL